MKRKIYVFVFLFFLAGCGLPTLGTKYSDMGIDKIPIPDDKARLFILSNPDNYMASGGEIYLDNALLLKIQDGFYYIDINTGKHNLSLSAFGAIGESTVEINVDKGMTYFVLMEPLTGRRWLGVGLIPGAIASNVDSLAYSKIDNKWFKTIKSTFSTQLLPLEEAKAKEYLKGSRINLKPSDPDYEKWRNKNSQTF